MDNDGPPNKAQAAHDFIAMGARIIADEHGDTVIAVPYCTEGLRRFGEVARALDLCDLPLMDTWGGYWPDAATGKPLPRNPHPSK